MGQKFRHINLLQKQVLSKGEYRDTDDIIIDGESQTYLELLNVRDWLGRGKIVITAYLLNTKEWMKIVRNINTLISLMSSKAVKLTDTELLK